MAPIIWRLVGYPKLKSRGFRDTVCKVWRNCITHSAGDLGSKNPCLSFLREDRRTTSSFPELGFSPRQGVRWQQPGIGFFLWGESLPCQATSLKIWLRISRAHRTSVSLPFRILMRILSPCFWIIILFRTSCLRLFGGRRDCQCRSLAILTSALSGSAAATALRA